MKREKTVGIDGSFFQKKRVRDKGVVETILDIKGGCGSEIECFTDLSQ